MIIPFDIKHIELKDGLKPFVQRLKDSCDRDYSIFNPNLTKKYSEEKVNIFQLETEDNTFRLRSLLVGTDRHATSSNQTFTYAFGDLKVNGNKLTVKFTKNWLGWTLFLIGVFGICFSCYHLFSDGISGVYLFLLLGGIFITIMTLWSFNRDKKELIKFLIKITEHNNR
ncbi:hypothetical protein GYB57_04595 [bacterium]|nr:hypothetical protein [bacterium]